MPTTRRTKLIGIFAVLLLVSATLVVGAQTDDWTDGPNTPENTDLNGIDKSTYIQLWSGDDDETSIDGTDGKVDEPSSDSDASDQSYETLKSFAEVMDFTFDDYPTAVNDWNRGAITNHADNLDTSDDAEFSYVPFDRSGDETDGPKGYIKDAYVDFYSIDPSTHIHNGEEGESQLYASSDGTVGTAVDYRIDVPESKYLSDQTRVEYERNSSSIEYQRLASEHCAPTDSNCEIGRTTNPSHHAQFEYAELPNTGEYTFRADARITVTFDRTVYTCTDDEDDEDDETSTPSPTPTPTPSGGGETGGHVQQQDHTVRGDGSERTQYASIELRSGDGTQATSSLNDEASECGNWEETRTTATTDSLTVTAKQPVYVQNKVSADVEYATFDNGSSAVHLETEGLWDTVDLPGDGTAKSGWAYYSARTRPYESLLGYYDGGKSVLPSPYPPLSVYAFPTTDGIQVEQTDQSQSYQYTTRVLGSRTMNPPMIRNSVRVDEREESYQSPTEVVIRSTNIDTGEATTVRGLVPGSESTVQPSSVRSVEPAIVDAQITNFNESEYTVNVSVSLTNEDGDAINLNDRDGVVLVNGEPVEVGEDGEGTISEVAVSPLQKSVIVEYQPTDWWEVPGDRTAYAGEDVRLVASDHLSIWDWMAWFQNLLLPMAFLFFFIRYGLLAVGVDIMPFFRRLVRRLARLLGIRPDRLMREMNRRRKR